MKTGKVKWFNENKGFGFLTSDTGEDIFVHFSAIQMNGFRNLTEGQLVRFDVAQVKLSDGRTVAQAAGVYPLDEPNDVKPNHRKLNVFLCHSSNDKPTVRVLYERLTKVPYISPWLDEKDLLPGQDWNLEIAKAVRTSDCVVVCLSKGATNKEGYLQKEIGFALDAAQEKPEGTIFLIPVRVELCDPPPRLARWQYVDFFEETGFQKLLLSLQYRATSLGILLNT